MKRLLKIVTTVIVVAAILVVGWLWYSAERNRAAATDDAIAATISDQSVSVESGDWLVMQPAAAKPSVGVIVYPGAYCDIRGYAPVLRRIAAAGYLVVTVSMPFDFAIFAPSRATKVREAYPEIKNWVLVGHSMGGSIAGWYAYRHQDELDGLIFWDAYPPPDSSLAESKLPVLHLHRAKLDGKPPAKHAEMRDLFPASSKWVPIPGGLHMYFGSFNGGVYEEQWEAEISREGQHDIVVATMLEWIQDIRSSM